MARMSFDFGLDKSSTCFKRRFRWLLKIPEISASGINSLPPLKSSRPDIGFKEIAVEHLNETIYLPGKPDWKPITLSLYDLKKNSHPVFNWLQRLYDPCSGEMKTPADNGFFVTPTLELYNGCGDVMETWTFEGAWPNQIQFGELEMSNSEFLTCDLTIRYSRAYINEECETERTSSNSSNDFIRN